MSKQASDQRRRAPNKPRDAGEAEERERPRGLEEHQRQRASRQQSHKQTGNGTHTQHTSTTDSE